MKNLFISCPHGFEGILQQELLKLQIPRATQAFCGVLVPKHIDHVFMANYQSRVATRVLWPIAEFSCKDKDDLYRKSKNIPWSDFLRLDRTFAIDANVQHPTLTHSLFAGLVVKDAICDFFREKTGNRPSVDKQNPDVQLNLFIQKGIATLYLDTSGAPLHKRGWRGQNTEATLHESLAAALLLFTGYTADAVFCDPFAGSGTFLIEAGLIATETPPGFFRKKWGFFHIPGFDKERWLAFKQEQDKKRIPLVKGKIFGSDKSREAADICLSHLKKVHLDSFIEMNYDEIAYYNPKVSPNFILTNPPYGKRLETTNELFTQIDHFYKTKAVQGAKMYILCPEERTGELASFGMKEKLSFRNGGLPVSLLSVS